MARVRRPGSTAFGQSALGDIGYGAVPHGITVRWDIKSLKRQISLIDEVTGNFRSGGKFRKALRDANDSAATQVQDAMVAELKRRVQETGRHQRGTKYLEISILDDNNRQVFANTFTVGRPSWMDRSPAKDYWRQIEYGNEERDAVFAAFTNTFTKGSFSGPWSPGGGPIEDPPPGYKNIRLPQRLRGGKGASFRIGPFPAYEFGQAGVARMQDLDMESLYRFHLGRAGIKLSTVLKK